VSSIHCRQYRQEFGHSLLHKLHVALYSKHRVTKTVELESQAYCSLTAGWHPVASLNPTDTCQLTKSLGEAR
jgi:hypothetical protein